VGLRGKVRIFLVSSRVPLKSQPERTAQTQASAGACGPLTLGYVRSAFSDGRKRQLHDLQSWVYMCRHHQPGRHRALVKRILPCRGVPWPSLDLASEWCPMLLDLQRCRVSAVPPRGGPHITLSAWAHQASPAFVPGGPDSTGITALFWCAMFFWSMHSCLEWISRARIYMCTFIHPFCQLPEYINAVHALHSCQLIVDVIRESSGLS
jgi:hypothetical protein